MASAAANDSAWNDADGIETKSWHSLPVLLQYWNALWRHRLLVATTFGACILIGALATALATPQYTASADIEISREQERVTNLDGLQSDRAGQSQEFYSTQYELLKARTLAERVTRNLGLARSPQFFEAHGTTIEAGAPAFAGGAGLSAAELQNREKRAIALLLSRINISPVRGSALVKISYESGDPAWSARLANAWANQFIQASLDRRFESTAEARKFLEGRLDGLRKRLDNSEQQLVNYAVRNNLVTVQSGKTANDPSQTITEVDLANLNQKLSDAVAARIDAEAKAHALAVKHENPETIENTAINNLRQKRAEVAGELSAMLVQFDPEYPPAQALQEQINALDRSIAAERSRVGSSANAELEAAQRRENQLRAQVDSLLGSLVREERSGIQFGILKREVDTNRELYDGLLQRFKEIGVAGVGANNIAIVDPAIPPSAPSSPNLMLNLLLAAIAGLALATAIVLVLENLDQGIRDPAIVPATFGVPLLGVIPEASIEDVRAEVLDRKSELAEAYSTVQSNVALSTEHGTPSVLMFTSTDKAEGKSTSAFALATGLARAGKRVVLVDADMRLPTLGAFIGNREAGGLSTYLSGDDRLDGIIQETGLGGLFAITSGPIPPSAPELLGGHRLDLLTNELKNRFDHVIYDSPPMLGLADALLLSRVADGIIYVSEADRGAVRVIAETINRLRTAKGHLIGLILTKYSARRSGYGYAYGSPYSYRYGNSEPGEADRSAAAVI
jgi:capsular exopolysaccharide synthesis family protein